MRLGVNLTLRTTYSKTLGKCKKNFCILLSIFITNEVNMILIYIYLPLDSFFFLPKTAFRTKKASKSTTKLASRTQKIPVTPAKRMKKRA